jgi:hypothetical protein
MGQKIYLRNFFMSNYKVEKAFENFAIGDNVILNPRQAKYRLLSGHIVEAEAQTDFVEVFTADPNDATAKEAAAVELDFAAEPAAKKPASGRRPSA